MKINKLNSKGFSHEVLIAVVVVLSVIIGVGFMVGSKAATPTKPVSSPVSVVSSVKNVSSSKITRCVIKNVGSKPKHGARIKPTVYIYNRELAAFTPTLKTSLTFFDKSNARSSNTDGALNLAQLNPNKSTKAKLGLEYSVPYKSDKTTTGLYAVSSSKPAFYCSALFKLPKQKASQKVQSPAPAPAPTDQVQGLGG